MAQSEPPSEPAVADDISTFGRESVIEVVPPTEVKQPVIEACNHEEQKPTDCSSSNNSKASQNTSECQQPKDTCIKRDEPSSCSGPIETECNGKNTKKGPSLKKAKPRPVSPCPGH